MNTAVVSSRKWNVEVAKSNGWTVIGSHNKRFAARKNMTTMKTSYPGYQFRVKPTSPKKYKKVDTKIKVYVSKYANARSEKVKDRYAKVIQRLNEKKYGNIYEIAD